MILHPNVVHSFYLLEDEHCVFNHIHFNSTLYEDITVVDQNSETIDLVEMMQLYNDPF